MKFWKTGQRFSPTVATPIDSLLLRFHVYAKQEVDRFFAAAYGK
jgi:hypothetical protein